MDLRRKATEHGLQNGKLDKETIRITMNWTATLIQFYNELHLLLANCLIDNTELSMEKVKAKFDEINKFVDEEI